MQIASRSFRVFSSLPSLLSFSLLSFSFLLLPLLLFFLLLSHSSHFPLLPAPTQASILGLPERKSIRFVQIWNKNSLDNFAGNNNVFINSALRISCGYCIISPALPTPSPLPWKTMTSFSLISILRQTHILCSHTQRAESFKWCLFVYVFRADHVVLGNWIGKSSLRRTDSSSLRSH